MDSMVWNGRILLRLPWKIMITIFSSKLMLGNDFFDPIRDDVHLVNASSDVMISVLRVLNDVVSYPWYKILNSVSIGKPIKGTKFLIKGNLKKGELLISGDQLFSNYLSMRREYNNKITKINNRKYYSSGDIFLKKGDNYYFINRKDRQIKRKGYRIELDEIDKLIRSKKVEFVHSFQNKKGKIVTLIKNKKKLDLNKIIKDKLPNYFMPDVTRYIDKVEYNQNNKVNYKKLEKLNSF